MIKRSIDRDNYYKALNLTQDPFQDGYSKSTFFTTPELQHRLDLLRHLLEFSQQILLVKGVSKVGKSTFCQHLMAAVDADWIICQIKASEKTGPDTLVKAMLHEHMGKTEDTFETIAGLNRYLEFCNLNSRVPILIIDDVDNLNQASLRFIFQLMEFKEQDTFIRVVLVGQESFLQRLNRVAEELSNNTLIHSVTIPAFTPEQTTAYLRHRLRVCGGREDMFTEKEESRIHKVAAGVAGDINFLARQGLSDPAELVPSKAVSKSIEKNSKKSAQIFKLMFASLALTLSIIALWLYWQEGRQIETKTVLLNLPPEPMPVAAKVTNETDRYSAEPLPDAWLESQVELTPSSVSTEIAAPPSVEQQSVQQNNTIQEEEKTSVNRPVQTSSAVDTTPDPAATVAPGVVSGIGAEFDKMKGDEWLRAQSDHSYVLQLIGAVELATITHFLQQARLDREKIALFKTKQSGKDWYVLVYGLYSDPEKARAAITSLPKNVQAEDPWPKSIASIHAAMKGP